LELGSQRGAPVAQLLAHVEEGGRRVEAAQLAQQARGVGPGTVVERERDLAATRAAARDVRRVGEHAVDRALLAALPRGERVAVREARPERARLGELRRRPLGATA